ncbi:hypothetical protein [Bacillus sp. FJAT-45066]|uniref:hypothetical protein n=1 Tax=Bacillus sp. FJAT-45066 TaxID=2011010 RepID=UPI000BB8B9AB|nr:hypothetical protein [Bacillus sp. FJAT-45066]
MEDIKSFQMTCAIYDKNGYLLLERKIVETLPSPFVYSSFLGKAKWESDHVFTVESQSRNWKEVIELL